VLPRAKETSKTQWLAFWLASAILLVISIGSHAAAEPRPVLPVLADWLHLLGASVWTGGLLNFVVGLRDVRQLSEPQSTQLTARLIPRFTRIALPSVAILAASSLYSLYLRVGSLNALANTFYGNTILGKIALFLPLLVLGAINFLAVTPRMRAAAQTRQGDAGLVQRFRRIVTAEVALAALVMLIVGLLTALPPAQDAANPAGLTAQEHVDNLRIALEIAPGQIGLNTYSVRLTRDGQPLSDAREVLLRFTPTTVDLPQSEVALPAQGDGLYSLKGANLGLPDEWQVQVVVRRENQFDAFANFYFPVGVAATQTFPWYRVAAVLLLAAGLALFFALRAHLKPSRRTRVFAPALAFSLMLAGLFVFYDPPGDMQARLPVNPVAPNAASLAAGEALYQQNCQNCHGATGRGDGPVGVTLNPRPADLSIHTEPGVHPDGQLFVWISEGFPGSAMPAFQNLLAEEDQWHLVNYIRTFSGE
jgi:copper transport protein